MSDTKKQEHEMDNQQPEQARDLYCKDDEGRTAAISSDGWIVCKDNQGRLAAISPDGTVGCMDDKGCKINIFPDGRICVQFTDDGEFYEVKPHGSTTQVPIQDLTHN